MSRSGTKHLEKSAPGCAIAEPTPTPDMKLDPRLRELADAINVNSNLIEKGGEARISNGSVELLKYGNRLGEWSIYDCWFEYRGQTCGGGQVHRAAWLERAIAMTISIVENIAMVDGRSNPAGVLFRAAQIGGIDTIVAYQMVGSAYPNLVEGQLTLRLRPGTDSEMARRIARQLNRDVVGLVISP